MKLSQLYLIAYNSMQLLGWSSILLKTIYNLQVRSAWEQFYLSCELELLIFQTAAILEVIHSITGLVRSSISSAVIQVYSRVSILWLVLYTVNDARHSIGVPMLLVAWSITEVIRYSFYTLNLMNAVPAMLIYLRYTLFIVLYPLGASGEVLCIFNSLHEVATKKTLTLEMPNAANFAFQFWYFLIFSILFYIPCFPKLYYHMFVLRAKVLGVEQSKKRE